MFNCFYFGIFCLFIYSFLLVCAFLFVSLYSWFFLGLWSGHMFNTACFHLFISTYIYIYIYIYILFCLFFLHLKMDCIYRTRVLETSMSSIPSLARRVKLVSLPYPDLSFRPCCCLSLTRTMLKSFYLLMISTRWVSVLQTNLLCFLENVNLFIFSYRSQHFHLQRTFYSSFRTQRPPYSST